MAALTLLLATICGCDIISINHTQETQKPVLPPIVAPRDAIELEVFFVERPLGDPLFGDTLWRELDQISTVSPQARARLFQSGVRFGVAGSSPPASLRALESASDARAEGPALRRQVLPLFAGQDGTLEVAVLSEPFEVVPAGQGGQPARRYDCGRCVVRVSGERTQDGWVKLHFLPEIHHGQEATRPVASEQDWQYKTSQSIDSFYEQQFDVELNQGEVIVLGATGDAADSLGGRFFRGLRDTTPVERLLVVRISTIKEITPVRATR